MDDLDLIYPLKAVFLRSLKTLVDQKQKILAEKNLSDAEKWEKISKLLIKLENVECKLDELSLTFVINPLSSVFQFTEVELVENGSNLEVTIDNAEEYLKKCLDFYLNIGIREQVLKFINKLN